MKTPRSFLALLMVMCLNAGCSVSEDLLSGGMYRMSNSHKTKIYPCYAEDQAIQGSPFYALVEAQQSYNRKDYEKALSSLDTIINSHSAKAKEMQNLLKEKPWESKDKIFEYKELNAVGAALVMKGLICFKLKDLAKAEKILNEQISDYKYAQCWNPDGWFITLDQEAENLLAEIRKRQRNIE